jgi:uncharacterized protein YndB with AHSA1/START domain
MAPRVEQEIVIDAPVDVVWRVVTEPEQVSKWFSDEVDLEVTPGYEGVLTFNDQATKQSRRVHVTVRSVEPERSYSYRWQHPPGAAAVEGKPLLVEFTLTPEGDGTRQHVDQAQ